MRASPSLNAEIARVVFLTMVVYDPPMEEYWAADAEGKPSIPVAQYSSDTHAAQNVVDHYYRQGWTFQYRKDRGGFLAGFSRDDGSTYRMYLADTLPLAICIAALGVAHGTHIQSK